MADYFDLTYDIGATLGVDPEGIDIVYAFVKTQYPGVVDTDANKIKPGTWPLEIDHETTTGSVSLPSSVDPAFTPGGHLFMVEIKYNDRPSGKTVIWRNGAPGDAFSMDADKDLADVVTTPVVEMTEALRDEVFATAALLSTQTAATDAQVGTSLATRGLPTSGAALSASTEALLAVSTQVQDGMRLARLATSSSQVVAAGVQAHRAAYDEVTVTTEQWVDASAWTAGKGQVIDGLFVGGGGGSASGHVRAFSITSGERARIRTSITMPDDLAGSLTYSFFGLSTDTTTNPSGNNVIGIGIDPQTKRPTAWIGSAAGGSGRVYLDADMGLADTVLPAGEYVITIVVDELTISMSLVDAAHVYEFRKMVLRSAFPTINSLAIWMDDSRASTGAKIGAISVRKASATINPRALSSTPTTQTYTTAWPDLVGWTGTAAQVSGGKAYALGSTGSRNERRPFPAPTAAGTSDFELNSSITLPAASASGLFLVGIGGNVSSGTGANDMLSIGFNAATREPVKWLGSNMVNNGGTSQTTIGSAMAAGATYPIKIKRTGTSIVFTLYQTDGVTVAGTHTVDTTTMLKSLANVHLWLSDARELTGAAIGGLTLAQSVAPVGKIFEGLADTVTMVRLSTGGNLRIALPKGYDSRRPRPVVMYHHGTGRLAGAPYDDTGTGVRTFFKAIVDAGYILASADLAGNAWGSPASVAEGEAAIKYVTEHYAVTGFVLIGQSMGGASSLNLLRSRNVGGIAAWYGIAPVANLEYQYGSSTTFAAQMRAAYGIASDGSDFETKVGTSEIADAAGWEFRGLPMRVITAEADSVVPPAENSVPLLAKVAAYAPEASYSPQTGTVHIPSSCFNAADFIAFAQRWLPVPPTY